LINEALVSLHSLALDCPILRTGALLLLQPLSGDVRVSSQTPIVVVVSDKHVDVPKDEQENQIDEASVDLVGSFYTH